ncbi:MAG: porin family protein [Elusimicrobiota bacterium]|jgi:hypothetical protein|nr:porin family protein [Elusimicrobiota bacterium]
MKKVISAAAVLLFFAGVGFAELNVKIGVDVLGNIKGDGYNPDVKVGSTLSGEYLYTLLGAVGLGAGFEYLYSRPIDEGANLEFTFLPIYATAKVKVPIVGVYAKANAGFNTIIASDFSGDKKGGFFVSGALGWEILAGLFTEISYGSYGFSIGGNDYEYRKIGLSVGYSFKLI